jgi:hypothetical protein
MPENKAAGRKSLRNAEIFYIPARSDKLKKILFTVWALMLLSLNVFGQLTTNTNPETVKFVTSDIDLFWAAYERATPENDLIVYRDEYLKKGSVGLQEFTKLRIGSSCGLVNSISASPKYYAALREPSLKIASYENQMRENFRKLKELYPAAVFPDVYFLIGRMTSAGTLNDKGLFIGVDMFGKNAGAPLDELGNWHKAVVSSVERIPYIVAHESIHYQQSGARSDTLLARSIGEGVADFVGELISGGAINPHLHDYANPREKELWLAFQKEMSGKDVKNWLYQGDDAKDKPADLGYYIGYKIAESYYKKASDKKQAIKDILVINDYEAFLKASRYENKFNVSSR